MRVLTVTNPFAGYALGQVIDSPEDIRDILAGEHAGHVVRSERPDPAPRKGKTPDYRGEDMPANNPSSQE